MKAVNIYDFDHTIYDGDASLDFIIYCLLRNARLWRYLPAMIGVLVAYMLGVASRRRVKEVAFRFLEKTKGIDAAVENFWELHSKKIKHLYTDLHEKDDIIISASPEFLLKPIAKKLGIQLIATKMNKKTGEIKGENCRGSSKVERLRELHPNLIVGKVYSDSLSDTPLIEIAKSGYIVRGDTITPFKDYKQPIVNKFMSPQFVRFIIVGCMNGAIGISLSYGFSLYIDSPQLAFTVGFAIGLVPSYFLNSVFTFKEHSFSLTKFGSFVVSYIPNFLIMFTLVYIFSSWLNIIPLVTYTLAVALAVPLTFILLATRTFKPRKGSNETE